MRYAQVRSGERLHLVYGPGEGRSPSALVPAGRLSLPLCNRPVPERGYRMTINVPLANACRNCLRIWRTRHAAPEAEIQRAAEVSDGPGKTRDEEE